MPRLNPKISNLIWNLTLLAAFALLVMTLSLIVEPQDPANHRLEAVLISQQSMIVIHVGPSMGSGVAGLLERGTNVNVAEYDPSKAPEWVMIESSQLVGWIPLANLAIDQPGS